VQLGASSADTKLLNLAKFVNTTTILKSICDSEIMENICFIEPKREILSPMDMPKWMKSQVQNY
jgi:hypothetical protein